MRPAPPSSPACWLEQALAKHPSSSEESGPVFATKLVALGEQSFQRQVCFRYFLDSIWQLKRRHFRRHVGMYIRSAPCQPWELGPLTGNVQLNRMYATLLSNWPCGYGESKSKLEVERQGALHFSGMSFHHKGRERPLANGPGHGFVQDRAAFGHFHVFHLAVRTYGDFHHYFAT
jgi:hypothetical protein